MLALVFALAVVPRLAAYQAALAREAERQKGKVPDAD